MTWTDIPDSSVDADSPITEELMTALRDNIKHGRDASTGEFEGASVKDASITGAKIASSTIAQGNLKTASGEVSHDAKAATAAYTLPGGQYGFYPQIKADDGSHYDVQIYLDSTNPTAYQTTICITGDAASGLTDVVYCRQRYIQASPPYDLGDGEIPLFVFVSLAADGAVLGTYVAEDPPWANNGPTVTRPDIYVSSMDGEGVAPRGFRYATEPVSRELVRQVIAGEVPAPKARLVEVDQQLKNADMSLIPHPFARMPSGAAVALLDPVSTERLRDVFLAGESISELLHKGYLQLSNSSLNRASPPGVKPVSFRWRNI